MYTVDVSDSIAAVRSVESERSCSFPIDRTLARQLILKVYALRTHHQSGDAFHALFQQSVEYYHIKSEQQKWYRCVIGRYFNPRALRAKKLKQDVTQPETSEATFCVVGIPTPFSVTLEIFADERITFSTLRLTGQLCWEDVVYSVFHPAISLQELHMAHKKAVSVLNSRR